MSEVMGKYIQLAVSEERIRTIRALIKKGCDKDFVLNIGYSECEYTEATSAERRKLINE